MEHPSKLFKVGEIGFYYFNDSGESKVTKAYDISKKDLLWQKKGCGFAQKDWKYGLLLQ